MEEINTYEMEVYSSDPKVIEIRRSKYFNELHGYFEDCKEISLVEYKRIRDSLNGGDRSVLSNFAEKSIYYIIISISKIYAKFDIEKYMTINEAFSYAFEKVSKYIDTFVKLPKCRAEYTESTINFLVYKVIVTRYQKERLNKERMTLMSPNNLTWTIDQIEKEELSLKDLNNKEFSSFLQRMFSILRDKEIQILTLKFGLNGEKVMTYKEIGEIYGVTRGRIEQIVKNAINKLLRKSKRLELEEYKRLDL